MITEFGHVLLCFAQWLAVLFHLHTHCEIENLVDDERTLEATFAGAISHQIGLDLFQIGQGSATGTDIEYLPSFHSPLPADGDVYCSGVDPILVPTDSITASHHFVACQHLVIFGKPGSVLARVSTVQCTCWWVRSTLPVKPDLPKHLDFLQL